MIVAREAYLITGGNTFQPSGLNEKRRNTTIVISLYQFICMLYILHRNICSAIA